MKTRTSCTNARAKGAEHENAEGEAYRARESELAEPAARVRQGQEYMLRVTAPSNRGSFIVLLLSLPLSHGGGSQHHPVLLTPSAADEVARVVGVVAVIAAPGGAALVTSVGGREGGGGVTGRAAEHVGSLCKLTACYHGTASPYQHVLCAVGSSSTRAFHA